MGNYSVMKAKAIEFSKERNMPVYITKARKQEHYRIIFSPEQVTPNFPIFETVYQSKKGV